MNGINKLHNIIKWVTLIMIILVVFIFSFEDDIIIFWVISAMLLFLPRLENSMDRVYCGQLMANHKLLYYDIMAFIFILVEYSVNIFKFI